MDRIDRLILSELQTDATISNARLADKVGTSPASCSRRIRKLWNSGVISRQVALLNARLIGRPTTIIVWIYLVNDRIDLLDSFKKACMTRPEISQMYFVTGGPDFVLFVNVQDIEHYHSFAESFFLGDSNIKKFESFVCMQTVRFETAIPIPLPA
jgi:Lrp/AsnC family leucine-responsive transcriptional regulator